MTGLKHTELHDSIKKNRMIIGVTGGVGTGKSTILEYLKSKYGAAVILADDVARDLMMPGNKSYTAVVNEFGDSILINGYGSEINRSALAEIIFHDENKLKRLNSLTHPIVKQKILSLINDYIKKGYNFIVIEAALFIQAGYTDISDELWVVYADYDSRVERLEKSRGYTKEKTDSIIRNQLSDSEMKSYADFFIDNSGTADEAFKQIDDYLSRK